jgi:hypothetical protein
MKALETDDFAFSSNVPWPGCHLSTNRHRPDGHDGLIALQRRQDINPLTVFSYPVAGLRLLKPSASQ